MARMIGHIVFIFSVRSSQKWQYMRKAIGIDNKGSCMQGPTLGMFNVFRMLYDVKLFVLKWIQILVTRYIMPWNRMECLNLSCRANFCALSQTLKFLMKGVDHFRSERQDYHCELLNTPRDEQNGLHFATIFMSIFNENYFHCNLFPVVSKWKSALVQVMAWCGLHDQPLPEPIFTKFTKAYIWNRASAMLTH